MKSHTFVHVEYTLKAELSSQASLPQNKTKGAGRLQHPVLSLGLSKDILSSVLFDLEDMCDEGGIHRRGSCLGFRV